MKATLLIEAAPSVLASILAMLPDGASVTSLPSMPGGDEDDGPANASAPAVDASGLPWDERIHAKTKAITGDGMWKKRRGGPSGDELAAIEAQLRAAAPLPPPVAAPGVLTAPPLPTPVADPAAALPPPVPLPAPVTGAPIPVQPIPIAPAAPLPTPVAPPMPLPEPEPVAAAVVQAPDAEGLDFPRFMQHLSAQMNKRDAAGQPVIHADYLAQITAEISTAWAPSGVAALTNITDVAANPQLITYAVQLMQRDGRW